MVLFATDDNNASMKFELLKKITEHPCPVALLIDPEKTNQEDQLKTLIYQSKQAGICCLLVGGSSTREIQTNEVVQLIKSVTDLPVILFPGDANQFTPLADAILLLNLISGRNPTYLIDQHVRAARSIWNSSINVVSTSYILLDGGKQTSVAHLTSTSPIPLHQTDLIIDTCIAGKLIGHQCLYLENGSGASRSIPTSIIQKVRTYIDYPIIVGGGITSKKQMQELRNAGASMLVIGTKIEQDPLFFNEVASFISECSSVTNPNL